MKFCLLIFKTSIGCNEVIFALMSHWVRSKTLVHRIGHTVKGIGYPLIGPGIGTSSTGVDTVGTAYEDDKK